MKGYVKPVLSACALSSTERIAVNCEDLKNRDDWDYLWESRHADGAENTVNNCAYGFWRYANGGS